MATRLLHHAPIRLRLVAATLAALATWALAPALAPARAQEGGASKKKDESKKDDEGPAVPPPREIEDGEWLSGSIEPFDRLFIAAAQFGGTENVIVDVQELDPRPVQLKALPGKPVDEFLRVRPMGMTDEFNIIRSRITKVKHWEDLLLEQGKKYLNAAPPDFDLAFEFYYAVVQRNPTWPGLNEHMVEYWYLEAQRHMLKVNQEDYEKALTRLHELRVFCRDNNVQEHPETKNTIGRAVDAIIGAALEKKNYPRARHYLKILEDDYPDHPIAMGPRRDPSGNPPRHPQLVDLATKFQREAKAKETAGQLREACYAIIEAADIWPELPGVAEDFDRIFKKYPILHVAVRELPDRFAPWAPLGSGDARVAKLLHVPMMEVSGVGENTTFDSRVLDPVVSEIGRRVTFTIKPNLRWSDGEKPITAMDAARSISARCDPSLPSYDASLKSIIKGVKVPQVNEIVVDLNRSQLRPQASFLFSLAAGHKLLGDRFEGGLAVGAGPFRGFSKRSGVDGNAIMQANQHFFGGKPKIAEVVERRYMANRDAVNALLAGDLTLVEHVPQRQLRRVEGRPELRVARARIPALHVVSFDFRSRYEFASRTLRRAMVYALDRKKLFEEQIIEPLSILTNEREKTLEILAKLPKRKENKDISEEVFASELKRLQESLVQIDEAIKRRQGDEIATGPFPKGSFAYTADVEPWYYDAVLAKGLADVAKKELQIAGPLRFKLTYPDAEEAETACKFLKEYWRIVGIDIDLEKLPPQVLEERVALGQRMELVYRIHYVTDPALDAARVLCLGQPISPSGQAMPNSASPWLRQNLRDLELASNWKVANEKLYLLQHECREDVAIIPLWQLVDRYAYHERLEGFVDYGLAFYQDAERWQIAPWFRKDPK